MENLVCLKLERKSKTLKIYLFIFKIANIFNDKTPLLVIFLDDLHMKVHTVSHQRDNIYSGTKFSSNDD